MAHVEAEKTHAPGAHAVQRVASPSEDGAAPHVAKRTSGQLPEPASDVEPTGQVVGAVAPAPDVTFSEQKVPAGQMRVVLDACPAAHQ